MNRDEIRWQILNAEAKWPNRLLSEDYGVPIATVRRWRSQPWVCPVAYVPCRWCGELVTQSPSSAHGNRRFYHDECRPEQLRTWSREAQRKRFHAKSKWEQMWALDDLAERSREDAAKQYQQTTPAPNNRAPWTPEQDAWLLENYRYNRIVDVAKHLGRTSFAVRRRYEKLKME